MAIHEYSPKPPTPKAVRTRRIRQRLLNSEGPALISGPLRFSKGSEIETLIQLQRDYDLESKVQSLLKVKTPLSELTLRVHNIFADQVVLDWPLNAAMRLSGSHESVTPLSNVFLFFPFAAGEESDELKDHFTLELIDVSSRAMKQVVIPLVEKTFSNADEILAPFQSDQDLEIHIYTYALLHELFHRLGPWAIIPKPKIELKSSFMADLMGEIAADTLFELLTPEHPAPALFAFLMRSFWYSSRDPMRTDNDACFASIIWDRLKTECKLGSTFDAKFELDLNALHLVMTNIGHETLDIAQTDVPAIAANTWISINAKWTGSQYTRSTLLESILTLAKGSD